MRLRNALVTAGCIFALLAPSPTNAAIKSVSIGGSTGAQADKYGRFIVKLPTFLHGRYILTSPPFLLSGTIWVDENRDWIRQPDEPAANSAIAVQWSKYSRDGYDVTVWSYLPGSKPVFWVVDMPFTHQGWAFFIPSSAERHQTLNIRVMQNGQHHLSTLNLPLADGHFFKETSGERFQRKDAGFAVTNADGIPFWDTWQRLGLENVGYPISHRYMWRGFVTQAFQKAIMQWQPGKGVFFVNIFDEMHDAGRDNVLRSRYATPHQLEDSFDASLSVEHREEIPESVQNDLQEMHWESIKERRLALLDANPAIKERYYAAPDPLLLYGLPTSRVEDMGNHYAIRTQRTVFQQWKEDVPWAKAGEVTIANGGDIVKKRNTTCEPSHSGGENCTHLFFPGRFFSYHGPIALTPQHISLFDVENRKSFPEAAILPQPAGFVGVRPP